ncbi:hypothetical protein [Actinoplanes sp. HUAS TT8]|uniref:hypothetical protein n=1 Tax=Actinoplanes sp. HUAS TT8 TaxID=3447453 RepID=UPI003F51FC5B
MLPIQDPPDGWPRARRSVGRILSLAGCVLLGLTAAFLAVGSALDGGVTEAVAFGGGALLLAHLAVPGIMTMRRPEPSARPSVEGVNDRGERGLAFTYSRWLYYCLAVTLALTVLGLAGAASASALGGTSSGWAVAALFAAPGIYLAWLLIVMLRLAPGTVVLTSTGVYHRSLYVEHFVPWEAISGVRPVPGPSPWIAVVAGPAGATRIRRHGGPLGPKAEGLPLMIIRAQWLRPDALPAYQALKHYLEHPGERLHLDTAVENPGGL